MKTRLVLILSIISIVTTSDTCKKNRPDCHVSYTINNNSGNAVYFIVNKDSGLNLLSYPPGASASTYKCEANSQKSHFYRGCYEYIINTSSTKMLYIFIFDAKIIETVPWDTVKKNYMLLKRYDMTKAQLDSINWKINYP